MHALIERERESVTVGIRMRAPHSAAIYAACVLCRGPSGLVVRASV